MKTRARRLLAAAATAFAFALVSGASGSARAAEPEDGEPMIRVEPAPPPPASAPIMVGDDDSRPLPRSGPHAGLRSRSGYRAHRGSYDDEPERIWYGWQTLLADSLGIATAPVIVGIPSFFLATPVIHLGHRSWGAAAASFGIRATGAGVAALGFVYAAQGGGGDFGALAAIPFLIAGGTIGLTSVVLDAALFAYQDAGATRDEGREARARALALRRQEAAKLKLAPSAGPMPGGGFAFGLSGTL